MTMKKIALSLALVVSLVTAASAETRKAAPVAAPAPNPTLVEIQKALGFVPDFFKSVPEALLPGLWQSMAGFQMNPNTKLDGKTKELIGLAVASQIPCEYCIYFHTEFAKLNGASDEEVREAVGMGAMTRYASTIVNGVQADKAQFKKDVQHIIENVKAAHAKK
jgi:AhpD family alkylhydroperoxidase